MAAIVIGGVAYGYSYFSPQKNTYETYTVKTENLEQKIEVSGDLKPKLTVDLSFQKSGQVQKINGEVGTRVKKGDILAVLENKDETAGLAQAKASLSEANAALNVQLAAATNQDIQISKAGISEAQAGVEKAQVEVENAKKELENAKKTVDQDIKVAQLQVNAQENAVKKAAISSGTTTNQNTADINNAISSLKNAIGQVISASDNTIIVVDKLYGLYNTTKYVTSSDFYGTSAPIYDTVFKLLVQINDANKSLENSYNQLPANPTADEVTKLADTSSSFIQKNRDILIQTSNLVNYIRPDGDFTAAQFSSFQSELTTTTSAFDTAARSFETAKKNLDAALIANQGDSGSLPLDLESAEINLESAKSNLEKIKIDGEVKISNAESKIKSLVAQYQTADASLQKAQASYQKTIAPTREVDVQPYRARISQQAAQLQKAQAAFDKTVLVAPSDGVITIKNIEVGEQVTSGGVSEKAALTVMDDKDFHIDIDVPETQITALSEKNKVEITFDALGKDRLFEGVILFIEPNATLTDNIVYYKVRIGMDATDPQLKPGMTANITIHVKQDKKSLVIPEKALIAIDGRKGVMVPDVDGKPVQKIVKTGIRGENGLIEITEGLNEGDKVLISNEAT